MLLPDRTEWHYAIVSLVFSGLSISCLNRLVRLNECQRPGQEERHLGTCSKSMCSFHSFLDLLVDIEYLILIIICTTH